MAVESKEKKEELLPPLSEDDRMLSGLCYPLWFIACPYILSGNKKKELFLYFHALQGLYYGASVSAASFLTLLTGYLIFFLPTLNSIKEPAKKMDFQITFSTISVVLLMILLFAMVLLVFFTLFLGWKASSGKIFRLPFIGSHVYSVIEKERTRLEMEYLDSLSKPDDETSASSAIPADNGTFSPYPANMADVFNGPGKGDGSPAYDYQKMLVMNPPVERLKSIFSQPLETIPVEEDSGEVFQPGYPAEEESLEELPASQENFSYSPEAVSAEEPAAPAQAFTGGPGYDFQVNAPYGPPSHEQDSIDRTRKSEIQSKAMSAMEKLQMLREREKGSSLHKVQPVRDAVKFQKKMPAPPKPREPASTEQEPGRANSTSFLSPQAHMDILRRKYEQSSMSFRPAKSRNVEPPGRGAVRPSSSIEKQRELTSPARQLEALRQQYAEINEKPSEPRQLKKRTPDRTPPAVSERRLPPRTPSQNDVSRGSDTYLKFSQEIRKNNREK